METDVEWQPLSVRERLRESDGPYDGVPVHLRPSLRRWLKDVFDARNDWVGAPSRLNRVVMYSQVPITDDDDHRKVLQSLLDVCSRDEQRFLDVLDACLHVLPADDSAANDLHSLLAKGGSVWTVSSDDRYLQRVVEPQAQAAFERATSPVDRASRELADAWSKAYGRSPDASDAWDHAIKAVEAVLIPLVVPGQDGAHIGHVIGQLDRQGQHWDTILKFNQPVQPVKPPFNSVQTLVGMLRLIYPNPDRHVGPDHRTVTREEARAVVQLAVTIVQWGRDGQIVKK